MSVKLRRKPTKIPVLLQAESAECGLAAIAMVLTSLGTHTSIQQMRGRLQTGRDGASLSDLAKCARTLGFEARGYRAGLNDLAVLRLPAILSWHEGHFVVLEKVTTRYFDIVDPAQGKRQLSAQEFLQEYTGVALSIIATAESKKIKRPRGEFFRFIGPFIPSSTLKFSLIAFFSLILFVIGLVPAYASRALFDSVELDWSFNVLLTALAFLPFVMLANFLSALGRARLSIWLETSMDRSLIETFMTKLMSLPYKFFLVRRSGDILVRMSSTAYVRDVLSSRLITAILDSVFLFGYLAVIALQAPTFVVPVAILATLQILAISIFSPRLRMLSERELAEMSTSQSAMLETLNAVETIKSSGLEKNALERWRKTYKQQLAASVARRKYDAVATSVQGALSFGSPILLTIAGVNLVLNEGLSVGQAVALVALGSAALSPVSTLGASLQALQTVRVHLDRLNDVMSEKPEDLNIKGTGILGPMRIELKNIVYSYSHNGTNVLKDINLTIKPGENIAIVGASGSGKSTLARIIIGLLRPEFGVLTINGEDISKVNLLSLRQSCGIVTQASEAVSGSIRSNILFGRSIGDEEVWRSLKVADLTKDIQNMPLGLNTPLGESGIGLSGGQLQRLAIARAVAAQPSVLVLDEATSHLDAATEARVVEQLASLGCTRIVIAHRLSTIRAASKVMLVENGEIVASGKHDDLLELANYREFFRNQITESVQQ